MFAAAGKAARPTVGLAHSAVVRAGTRPCAVAQAPLHIVTAQLAIRALSTALDQWGPAAGAARRPDWQPAWRARRPRASAVVPWHGRRWMSSGLDPVSGAGSGMPPPPVGTKVPPLPKVASPLRGEKKQDDDKQGETRLTRSPATLPEEPGGGLANTVRNGLRTLAYLPYNMFSAVWRGMKLTVTDPKQAGAMVVEGWGHFKDTMKHYWLGTKLLAADSRTAARILRRVLSGHTLTRRERKQLLRTTVDLLRLVPMAVFVLVPFMELLLPVALKLFPNMLPSTFQTSREQEQKLKRQLRARLRMADFLQQALQDMASDMSQRGPSKGSEESVATLLDVINRVRNGEQVPTEMLMKCAKLFKDELTMENAPSDQLKAMARYMGLPSFGSDHMLRFQLRNHLRLIKEDDKQILWEGLDALNRDELRVACQERGMRATGLSKTQYRKQLQQWLELSVNKEVPASLLIMSRVFMITTTSAEQILKDSLAGMDDEVLSETVLDSVAGQDDAAVRALKLELTHKQNELIAAEAAAEAEAAAAAAAAAAEEAISSVTVEELVVESPDKVDVAEVLAVEQPDADTAPALTEEEAEKLAVLAAKSALESERELLAELHVEREVIEAEAMMAQGRIGAEAKEDRATERMKDYLDSMLQKLDSELRATDEVIGDKLKVLDRNDDGFISVQELEEAVADMLGPGASEDEVWNIIRKLDADGDGVVPVDLLQNAAKRQRQREKKRAAKQDAAAAEEAKKKHKRRKEARARKKKTSRSKHSSSSTKA